MPVDYVTRYQSQNFVLDAVGLDKLHHAWVASQSKRRFASGPENMHVRGSMIVGKYHYPVALDNEKCWHYNPTDGFSQSGTRHESCSRWDKFGTPRPRNDCNRQQSAARNEVISIAVDT